MLNRLLPFVCRRAVRHPQLLSSGQCGCLDYDLTQGDDYEEVYNRLDLIDDLIGDAPAEVKRKVVSIICSTTINDGDHLQVILGVNLHSPVCCIMH